MRNTVAPLAPGGHVAGWLGVGGPGLGPRGSADWLQIGYLSLPDGTPQQIYYEVAQPGRPPRYHTVRGSVAIGAQHRFTVLELRRRPNYWRVWLDGKPVSPVIRLPASHGRFEPQAIGETWSAATGQCNTYGYSFRNIQAAQARGRWGRTKAGYIWSDKKNQVVKNSPTAFTAYSTAAYQRTPPHNQPPLLGTIASNLAGTTLTLRCQNQSAPVRKQSGRQLSISNRVCAILDGYAVADPWVPRADQPAGLVIAKTAFNFLRGVAPGTPAAQIDCRALNDLYPAFLTLDATPKQARAFHHAATPLLRGRCA